MTLPLDRNETRTLVVGLSLIATLCLVEFYFTSDWLGAALFTVSLMAMVVLGWLTLDLG